MSEEDVSFLIDSAQHLDIKKGETVLKEGVTCRAFYLVETGCLRTWYNKDGTVINLNFALEGEFATNITSIKKHEPSNLTIDAIEDSSIWIFDLDVMAREHDSHPTLILFVRRLSTHLLVASEEHSNLFKLYTPTERYRYIEEHNPRLLQRISLSQLASYLGVTRETLSRIRGKKD